MRIFWQWLRNVEYSCESTRPPLWMNLDETSIPYSLGTCSGTMRTRCRYKVSKSDHRGSSTLIVIVSAVESMQQYMPSFLLCNQFRLSVALSRRLAASATPRFYIMRRKSAWNNSEVMLRIIQKLMNHLSTFLPFCTPALMVDCAPCHFNWTVLRHAKNLDLRLIFIPANTTGLLQVCDVYVFRKLKCWLRRLCVDIRARNNGNPITVVQWFEILLKVPEFLQSHSWRVGFERTTRTQGGRVTSSLAKLRIGNVSRRRPTHEQLRLLFPKHSLKMELYALLFHGRPISHAIRVEEF